MDSGGRRDATHALPSPRAKATARCACHSLNDEPACGPCHDPTRADPNVLTRSSIQQTYGSVYVLGASPSVYAFGVAHGNGDVIRIKDTLDDDGVFPSKVEFRRCPKLDEEEVRRTLEENIR